DLRAKIVTSIVHMFCGFHTCGIKMSQFVYELSPTNTERICIHTAKSIWLSVTSDAKRFCLLPFTVYSADVEVVLPRSNLDQFSHLL
ncbi:unnamed protein product, partial [Pieris macdunnoughi]